jgi:hypothetical protein
LYCGIQNLFRIQGGVRQLSDFEEQAIPSRLLFPFFLHAPAVDEDSGDADNENGQACQVNRQPIHVKAISR